MKKILLGLACFFVTCASNATIGTTDYGYGVVSKGMGGTGVAQAQDGFTAAINPAALAFLEQDHLDIGFNVFNPERYYAASNPPSFIAAVEPGKHNSGSRWFFIPNTAYTKKLFEKFTTGIVLYANGGLNTNYKSNGIGSGFGAAGNTGVYGGGQTGGELKQIFVNMPLAMKVIPNVSVGASFLILVESLKQTGFANFAGFSISPENLTNRFTYTNFGFGARLGTMIKITDKLALGAGYQPQINPGRMKPYQGLLPGGSIQIPANLTAGVNFWANEQVQFNVDYQHIWYEDTLAFGNLNVCNPFAPSLCLGPRNGTGFGFRDTNAIKLGAEWLYNELWKLRAGYVYTNNPIRRSQVILDIVAPALAQNHLTFGFTRKIGTANNLNFNILYVPTSKLVGPNAYNPNQVIELAMHQFELGLSWTWLFDAPTKPFVK